MKRVYLIAVIVALLAGCATYLFAQSLIENSSIQDAPTEQVLVALTDIPSGTTITAEQVEQQFYVKTVLAEDLTPNAVKNFESVVGFVLTQDVFAGEQLNSNVFVNRENGQAGLSFSLEEGEVAYSISADAVKGVDGYIKPGDTIDIVAFYTSKAPDEEGGTAAGTTEVVFKDLEVLRVATYQETEDAKGEVGNGEVKTYVSVTVKTNDEQAQEIYDMEMVTGGNFKIILNSRIDAEKITQK